MVKNVWALVFLIITICLFVCQSIHAAILLDRVVAVVNKEVITWSELYRAMEAEAPEHVRSLNEKERNTFFRSNEAAFLEKLIDIKLQLQEAGRLGLRVTDEELKEAIENIKKKYQMTDALLEESLKKEGMTLSDYKRKLSEQILISQLINHQIRKKVVISEEEVTSALKSRGNRAEAEEEFRLRQIFFKMPKNGQLKKEIEEKAAIVYQRVKGGEDFAAIAWEYSEDPSAKVGADLGYLKKSDMAAEFVHVLSGMKVGDISTPFWTERGLHIVKLEDRVSAKNNDVRRADIRAELEEEAFAEQYRSYIKNLRERARIEIRL